MEGGAERPPGGTAPRPGTPLDDARGCRSSGATASPAGTRRTRCACARRPPDAPLGAVGDLAGWASEQQWRGVALGVDAAAGDPESPLNVSAEGHREAGRI